MERETTIREKYLGTIQGNLKSYQRGISSEERAVKRG